MKPLLAEEQRQGHALTGTAWEMIIQVETAALPYSECLKAPGSRTGAEYPFAKTESSETVAARMWRTPWREYRYCLQSGVSEQRSSTYSFDNVYRFVTGTILSR